MRVSDPHKRTTPLGPIPYLTVHTLRIEVVEGPDVGATHTTETNLVCIGSAARNDLVLTDPSASGYHVELERVERGVEVRDLGSTNGTRFRNALLSRATVPIGSQLRLGRTVVAINDGGSKSIVPALPELDSGMIAHNPKMRQLFAQVEKVSTSGVPVLLFGESGSGKEVLARLFHQKGSKADKPFITVDCGAFSPELVASELFGHERGSFTGADRRNIGAFERASGGTLFLDEVGELPLELQPQLLGALERRRFRRLGGQEDISVEFDLIAATHRDLREEVNRGTFRLDLYYRIAAVVLRIPPLRERHEDLVPLMEHFLRERGCDEPLDELASPEMLHTLANYRWPGNVRELRNWVYATIALGEVQQPTDVTPELGTPVAGSRPRGKHKITPYRDARDELLKEFEVRYVKDLLEASGGNVSEAARRARMDRTYLTRLVQKHGLK